VPELELAFANDNNPVEDLPATGTERLKSPPRLDLALSGL
jgi:hypothetical protein